MIDKWWLLDSYFGVKEVAVWPKELKWNVCQSFTRVYFGPSIFRRVPEIFPDHFGGRTGLGTDILSDSFGTEPERIPNRDPYLIVTARSGSKYLCGYVRSLTWPEAKDWVVFNWNCRECVYILVQIFSDPDLGGGQVLDRIKLEPIIMDTDIDYDSLQPWHGWMPKIGSYLIGTGWKGYGVWLGYVSNMTWVDVKTWFVFNWILPRDIYRKCKINPWKMWGLRII